MSEEKKSTKMAMWCSFYNCWCNDVEVVISEEIECELDCKYCGKLEIKEK